MDLLVLFFLCPFSKSSEICPPLNILNHETVVQGLNVDNKVNELADLCLLLCDHTH